MIHCNKWNKATQSSFKNQISGCKEHFLLVQRDENWELRNSGRKKLNTPLNSTCAIFYHQVQFVGPIWLPILYMEPPPLHLSLIDISTELESFKGTCLVFHWREWIHLFSSAAQHMEGSRRWLAMDILQKQSCRRKPMPKCFEAVPLHIQKEPKWNPCSLTAG